MGNNSSSSKKAMATDEKSATLFDDGPKHEKRDISFFKNANGDQIGFRSWVPSLEKATGLLFLIHGLHEHGGRYAAVAHYFTKRGFAVYAHDHVGHGRSYGEPAFVPEHGRMCRDAVDFVIAKSTVGARANGSPEEETSEATPEANVDLPIYVLGHSMGSLVEAVALSALQADPIVGTRIKKVVFSGCPLLPGPGSASPLGIRALYPLTRARRLLRGLGRAFAAMDPSGPNAPIDDGNLSHDPEVAARARRDALHYDGRIKNKTGYEIILMSEEVRRVAPSIKYPARLIHGADDAIAYPDGSRELLDKLGSGDKSLQVYENCYHEVLNEPSYESVLDEIYEFFTVK